MTSIATRLSWTKRIFLSVASLIGFLLLFVIALRVTVTEMYRGGGIESSRATGLSAVSNWDVQNMWSSAPMLQKSGNFSRGTPWESAVARTAALQSRSSSFDQSVAQLHQIVSAHQGYLEDLRTESQSGTGRALAATLSVPSKEFDETIADLKGVGRTEAVSQAGEDSAVKLATAERHFAAAQTNLARLQKLQRERKGELRDAVALEKDIAQANEAVAEAQRQQEALLSTVAQAHIRFTLMEDYRAPLETNLAGSSLALRNAFVEGVSAIFSPLALVLGVLLEFGLPLFFWGIILFWPLRAVWRRIRHTNASVPANHAAI
jgi:Domain of unknown function (DUF4349)